MRLPQPLAELVVMKMVREVSRRNGGGDVYYADLREIAKTDEQKSAILQVRDASLKELSKDTNVSMEE